MSICLYPCVYVCQYQYSICFECAPYTAIYPIRVFQQTNQLGRRRAAQALHLVHSGWLLNIRDSDLCRDQKEFDYDHNHDLQNCHGHYDQL